MKKPIKAIACAAAAMAAGCATVKFSTPGAMDGITIKGAGGRPARVVMVDVTGYYLLWTLPLFSGDMSWNDQKKSIEGGTAFFTDHVGVDEVQNALTKLAESQNCDLAEVSYYDSDTTYAGPSYSGIAGAFFGSSRIGVSAVMIPRGAPGKSNSK